MISKTTTVIFVISCVFFYSNAFSTSIEVGTPQVHQRLRNLGKQGSFFQVRQLKIEKQQKALQAAREDPLSPLQFGAQSESREPDSFEMMKTVVPAEQCQSPEEYTPAESPSGTKGSTSDSDKSQVSEDETSSSEAEGQLISNLEALTLDTKRLTPVTLSRAISPLSLNVAKKETEPSPVVLREKSLPVLHDKEDLSDASPSTPETDMTDNSDEPEVVAPLPKSVPDTAVQVDLPPSIPDPVEQFGLPLAPTWTDDKVRTETTWIYRYRWTQQLTDMPQRRTIVGFKQAQVLQRSEKTRSFAILQWPYRFFKFALKDSTTHKSDWMKDIPDWFPKSRHEKGELITLNMNVAMDTRECKEAISSFFYVYNVEIKAFSVPSYKLFAAVGEDLFAIRRHQREESSKFF